MKKIVCSLVFLAFALLLTTPALSKNPVIPVIDEKLVFKFLTPEVKKKILGKPQEITIKRNSGACVLAKFTISLLEKDKKILVGDYLIGFCDGSTEEIAKEISKITGQQRANIGIDGFKNHKLKALILNIPPAQIDIEELMGILLRVDQTLPENSKERTSEEIISYQIATQTLILKDNPHTLITWHSWEEKKK